MKIDDNEKNKKDNVDKKVEILKLKVKNKIKTIYEDENDDNNNDKMEIENGQNKEIINIKEEEIFNAKLKEGCKYPYYPNHPKD